jgi:hypothetical protein
MPRQMTKHLFLFLFLLFLTGCHVSNKFRVGQYVKDKNGTVYIILDERQWNGNYLCQPVYGERIIKYPNELEPLRASIND